MTTFLKLAIPATITVVVGWSTSTIQSLYAGTMQDPINLAVMGLSSSLGQLIIDLPLFGINSTQETLTSQAFGAGNLPVCGVYLNRGHFIVIAAFIPLAVGTILFGEDLLLLLGQDAEVSALSSALICWLIPGSFCFGHYDLQKRWMAAQHVNFFPMAALMVGTVLYIPLCYLFFSTLEMGILGLAYATSIFYGVILIAVLSYCFSSSHFSQSLQRVDSSAFEGWGAYLRISMPVTFMMLSDAWLRQILMIIAGTLGVAHLACYVVINNVSTVMKHLSAGLTMSASNIISRSMGANDVVLAKRYYVMINKFCIACFIVVALTTVFARKPIAALFSSDEEVRQLTEINLLLLAIYYPFDGMQ